jgi:heptosyltransferase-1
VPLIAIFGGSDPGLTGPVGQGPIAVIGRKTALPSVSDVTAAFDRLRKPQ